MQKHTIMNKNSFYHNKSVSFIAHFVNNRLTELCEFIERDISA